MAETDPSDIVAPSEIGDPPSRTSPVAKTLRTAVATLGAIAALGVPVGLVGCSGHPHIPDSAAEEADTNTYQTDSPKPGVGSAATRTVDRGCDCAGDVGKIGAVGVGGAAIAVAIAVSALLARILGRD